MYVIMIMPLFISLHAALIIARRPYRTSDLAIADRWLHHKADSTPIELFERYHPFKYIKTLISYLAQYNTSNYVRPARRADFSQHTSISTDLNPSTRALTILRLLSLLGKLSWLWYTVLTLILLM